MIGLLPSRPQRGRSGFRDLDRLSRDFELLFERPCVDVPLGRPTPEKALQSWMTANAYRHGRRLEALDRATADAVTTLFVADELALPLGSGKRIVCDLLALRCHPDGRQIPAVIELKSAREMKRLVEQVESYASVIEKNQGAFEALFSAVLGQPVCFSGPAERWIVWPQAGALSDPRAETLAGKGIRVVGYSQSERGFAFRGACHEQLALEGPALPSEVGSISAGPTPLATRLVACHAAGLPAGRDEFGLLRNNMLPVSALVEDRF